MQDSYPVKYSVVIPSYNHCEDLLRPCIESIKNYTDMSNVEVIVVANGCTDNTKEYMASLDHHFKMIWLDEPSGYTKSTNEGIKVARGEYVILLNNDTELLHQQPNTWLQMLEEPFVKDPNMGLVGPLMLHDDYADHDSIIFFCVMIKREVFDKIGILDEIFTPGGGEDIDFTVRAAKAGYTFAVAGEFKYNGSTNHGTVPIWHKDNKTLCEMPEYTRWIVKRNGLINAKRYNKNIKLNLGSGGISYPGFLSVDLYDRRAHIASDITKLDLDDNSVSEILASHVFEHLNPYTVMDALREWHRILRPGGKLVMEMPDIEQLFKNFITSDTPRRYGITNAIYGSVNTTDTGNPWDITSPHLYGWWPEAVRNHLRQAGFKNIETMDEKIPHPEANFRVEATK